MNSDFMGRYRQLVAVIVQHANIINKHASDKVEYSDGIFLTPNEWEVLEYAVEHKDNVFSMVDISRTLGIPQSSFSKIVKTLQTYGLVDKYTAEGNNKNIIIRPTEKADEVYVNGNKRLVPQKFQPFFDCLSDFSDKELEKLVNALKILNESLDTVPDGEEKEIKLIKK